MKEANFTRELMDSMEAAGMWCYKISDSPASWTKGITRFTPEKPCDVIACHNGWMIAIECKQLKKFEAFGRTQIRQSQIDAADKVVAAGGRAYIALNIRIKAIKGKQKHDNRLIIFDWEIWGKFLANETIKKPALMEMPYVVGKDGMFDVSQLLQ